MIVWSSQMHVVILLFLALSGAAQGSIDSLETAIENQSGEGKITTMNRLAFRYRLRNPENTLKYAAEALKAARGINLKHEEQIALSNLGLGYRYLGDFSTALQYQQQALNLALELQDDHKIATEYNRLGIIYKQWGFYQDALTFYLKALSIREKLKDTLSIANLYNNIGNVYRNRGNLDLALEYYLKTKYYRELLDDSDGLAYILNNIGNIYSDLRNYPLAIEMHNKSLELKKEMGDKYGIASSYSNLGEVYLQLGEVDKAMEFFQKALALEEEIGSKKGIALSLSNIGNAYKSINNFNKALEYHNKALRIKEEIEDKHGIASSLIVFSDIFIQKGEYDRALEHLDRGLVFARQEMMLDMIREIYDHYSEIYSLTGQYEKALEYYKLYSEVKDSVFNAEIGQKITQLQLSHLTDQHERERSIIRERNDAEIRRKNQFIAFLVAITLLVILLGFLIQSRYRINKRANRILEQKNKSIMDQNHFLQALMDTIPNPMYYKDLYGKYLGCNSSFEKMTGKSREEIKGKEDKDLFPSAYVNKQSEKDSVLIRNPGMQQYELKINWAGEESRDVIFYRNTFHNADGSVAGHLGIILDITERKRSERRLKRSEEELRSANAAKDTFFSIIAHDLINPFNAILGFSRLLIDEYGRFDEKERKKMITNINNVAENTSRLLQNLLDWARAQTGKMELYPETIDMPKLVHQNIELVGSMAAKKNIKLHCDDGSGDFRVMADKNMVNAVVRNLILNALKFTPHDGRVNVSFSIRDGYILTSIEDTGIGMDKEELKKLFSIDRQVRKKGTDNESGTGLGLMLCKEFVEKNGGSIRAESKPGEGSRFFVALPTADQRQV